ncbi:tyrosine-type recombinase/integrase [Vibrio parahaemolyticus]|uniref:tyrosine-type recombinase/integrase n=1 Tax=Vibrio parahaemolyticus TaxID=670 RepID=UPI0012E23B40|nr:integrase arm-type DNA-binding domain-containing protein [Vibrio parahaemolyticus]EHR5479226.1 tyrosine-type recombinase/integrase [Vibrio parahaemolyticus]EJB8443769.1 tyrosine-type recombinase/integrase [Vibrio parahaemolyticus]MBY3751167.1 tyrosine-type recombinase/integrase [Vibrio parahaemolyticus]MBY3761995.1 tyrosine-type recombinase/integrase [Vibrio parahaemolyticus]MBY3763208.1 tyrosine-type recombinase/integrase [Vibrio parahaemolyticus]
MARTVTPLTNTEVKQAKASGKVKTLRDGGGLELRVSPTGSKSWIFKYRVPLTSKRTNISFGSYPSVTLAQARQRRTEASALLAQNIDPKAHQLNLEREARLNLENTFSAFAARYLSIKSETARDSTFQKRSQMLNKYLLPVVGRVPISEIKPLLMKGVLDPIAKQGKIETVKRLCIIANEVMRLAVAGGAIEFNPIAEITKLYPTQKVNHQPALSPDELPELVKTIDKANVTITTRNLILWQLHTMVRPSEAAKAKWSDIDYEEGLWRVYISKIDAFHYVPLTPQALDILENMKPISMGREYIFPASRNPKAHSNIQSANMALKRMGFKDRTTAHGLRGLASTTLNANGFDGDVIEAALSHQEPNKIRRAYNHTDYLERRKPLMCWWSERIEQASLGERLSAGVRGLKVVSNG